MLVITDLVKKYGKFTAVDGLNLRVEDGQIFGFVGPNGAGKTTTMKIMSGLLAATSGSVMINGTEVVKRPRDLRERIGYMPDFFGVYDNLKIEEYMDFYAGAYGIPYRERLEIIGNLLELVSLTDKRGSYVDSLSRGMKQRLCLARSLVHDPEVLILDEPASGLDPRARVEMKEILKELKTMGKTIVISSHILTEMAEMCTAFGIVDKGKIVANGTVSDIMRRMTQTRVVYAKPLGQMEQLERLLSEKPDVDSVTVFAEDLEFSFSGTDEDLAALLAEIVKSGIPIINFREKEGNLEDIFMRLTVPDGGTDGKGGGGVA